VIRTKVLQQRIQSQRSFVLFAILSGALPSLLSVPALAYAVLASPMKDIYHAAQTAFHLQRNIFKDRRTRPLPCIYLETAASKSQSNVSKTRKKGKKNKRVAQAEIFDDRRSMATNGDSKIAENVKQNVSAAAAPEEPTKKADVPSSEKKKVQFFMNLEIGPRVDKKKEDPELADYEPRNDSESTSDDGEEGKSKGKIFEESDCVGMHHSAVQVGSLETVHNGDGLSGATISFADAATL
jgi:hypothetical protein